MTNTPASILCKPIRLAFIGSVLAVRALSAARAEISYCEEENQDTVVKMAVTPAAEPVPVLRYRLISRDLDLTPGNAAPFYYRAFMETPNAVERLRKELGDAYHDEYEAWFSTDPHTPTSQLPLEKLSKVDATTASGLIEQYLTEAASRRNCDWQLGIEELTGPDVISFTLAEFQVSREICRMLAVRTRLAIAENRYSDALDAMRINFRLGTDVAHVPIIVCGLIGIAEAGIVKSTALELIAAPDSPNLYWALSELPQPFIDFRAAARCELGIGPRIFPFFRHAESASRSPEEWNRMYTVAMGDLSTVGGVNLPALNDLGAGIAASGGALLGYTNAKEQLIAQGMDRERVEKMAVGQVIAIYTEQVYQQIADDYEKLWYMPYWEMNQRVREVDTRLDTAHALSGNPHREVLPIASTLIPAMQAVRSAQIRFERDLAALRVIEALRMYAADHTDALPAMLDEIKQVPVPLNPATGKPFRYRLDGETAILELPKSDGIPGFNKRFEISIVPSESPIGHE